MKKNWTAVQLGTVLTIWLLSGCGTVSTRTKGEAGPYRGLGYDMEKVSNADEWLELSGTGSAGNVPFLWPRAFLWILDAPLSFAADTLLLPADALRSKSAEHDTQSEVAEPDGAVRQGEPVGSETNRTSSAAASERRERD